MRDKTGAANTIERPLSRRAPAPPPLKLSQDQASSSPAARLPHLPPAPQLPPRWLPGRPPAELPREPLRPRYAANFHCISSACEDTCCTGWSVPVDQATYLRFQTVDSLKHHLGTLIVLKTAGQTASDYARIPQTASGPCPMLQKENLCSLHQQHGPEMLPHTCATYPRAVSTNSGQTETALHLSCPEAARVTLLDPNLLGDFATAGLPAGGDPVWPDAATHRYARFGPAPARPDRLYDPGLALREYVLLLLTDRRYPLWQRLYLAGILARRIDIARGDSTASAWCADNPARVAKLLADSARTLVLDRLRPVMDGFHADPAQQLQLLIEILRLRLDQPGVPARFMECVRDFQLGLGCTTAAGEQQILSAYAEAHSRYYLPLLHRHPHILENYLANYVFKNHYPFGRPRTMPLAPGDTPDAQSEHLLLCAHAALAQMLLIGMAGRYGKAFALEHVIQLMQSLARTIEHSPHFLEQVPILLRQKNLLNLRGIAVLTRHDA